jgi:hypothetical protein
MFGPEKDEVSSLGYYIIRILMIYKSLHVIRMLKVGYDVLGMY